MDTSCTSDDEITSDTISATLAPPITTSTPPVLTSLCQIGIGASVIIDPEGGVEVEAPLRKLPSSRYKGVVPQPNGRWGAQIYEKHQRVWLGTFNNEDEAAKAYDIAVQRFRGQDAITNFRKLITNNKDSAIESNFLTSHSKSEIVDMLRKHTYNDELEQTKRTCNNNSNKPISSNGSKREHLFKKTVTPSDVGKLNRLVIPKQHAEKHFPVTKGTKSNGLLLHFEDNDSKVWRFRYSYWSSSQSYVLTKGWNRFVKEKKLKAGDCVSFQSSNGPEKRFYIDWESKTGPGDAKVSTRPVEVVEQVRILRLFGVEILSCSGKRSGVEMDLLGFKECKKQRVIDVL